MGKSCIRIEEIEIENFKNTKYGILELENKRSNYSSSILGLYGQNGSGKTALIDALKSLKYALCGRSMPEKFGDYVNVDANYATLKFKFKMKKEGEEEEVQYEIWYQFSIRKVLDDTHSNDDIIDEEVKYRAEIYDEKLSFSYKAGKENMRKNALVDTINFVVFGPQNKYQELLDDNSLNRKSLYVDWFITKYLVQKQGRSFVFSKEMLDASRKNCKNKKYMDIIEGLQEFGNKELFVIDTENSGLISMNALPLSFKYREDNAEALGNILISLEKSSTIPEKSFDLVKKIIRNMNIALEQIVPGLTIGIEDLGTMISKEGRTVKIIQLMSLTNSKKIPLQYESEGIKKIISVLQLLIVVYNNPSVTVAIDELDAGIFEYLLGELLGIISEKGKGQLIFTSHNLRPLETIDKGFIAFTTTNPNNRYIRMTNVKGNNNLRDFYYRDIVLGEQKERVYNSTNNFEIALALREAGEILGS